MSIADPATTCFVVKLIVGAIPVIGEATRRLRLPYGKLVLSSFRDFCPNLTHPLS